MSKSKLIADELISKLPKDMRSCIIDENLWGDIVLSWKNLSLTIEADRRISYRSRDGRIEYIGFPVSGDVPDVLLNLIKDNL